MAYRTFAEAGITAAAGSDFGPGLFAPLMGIQGMVTRKGWNGETWGANQRISVAEALRVNTINDAYASHEEAIKGSITPGKLADFVVLTDDPHTVDPDKIKGYRDRSDRNGRQDGVPSVTSAPAVAPRHFGEVSHCRAHSAPLGRSLLRRSTRLDIAELFR
jgi:hypothetical protein